METIRNLEETKKYWLGIKLVPAFRNRIYRLVKAAGGPGELWKMSKNGLLEMGLSEEVASESVAFRETLCLDHLYEELINSGVYMVTDEENSFPQLLREAPGHPRAIFVKGELKRYKTAVAIVGARRCTAYGRAIAAELAKGLADAGVAVISGAARGIDTEAHRGAINAGGVTFGVLGCGLDMVYPPENKKLFEEIIVNGALISEYPPGTFPQPQYFPARNRIVAGMCQAVVVVEAGNKSGALITADFALEYGRDVFAVPGYSKNETSRGANKLIKQGAYLVESVEDILEVLGIEMRTIEQNDNLTEAERDFLKMIGWEGKRFDEIARETDTSLPTASALLLALEISGYVKKDITGCYLRLR